MTKNNNIKDTTLEMVRSWGDAEYMEEGLVLTHNITKTPINHVTTRLNFILMALCTRGHAEYRIDTIQHEVTPGDLLFVSERHIVDNFQNSPDYESLCIMVSTDFYHDFVQNVKNVSSLLLFSMKNPVVRLTAMEAQTFSNYYHNIRQKMKNSIHPYRTELVKSLLLTMFYDMSGVIYRVEQQGNKAQSRADAFFSEFIQLLEKNFRKERRVSWYASQLNITPKYLSEVVKSASKRTPTEWIDDYVILEMRVLLKNSTKNIKELADELNFPNQSFMGKYFKERVGVSPSTFRRKN